MANAWSSAGAEDFDDIVFPKRPPQLAAIYNAAHQEHRLALEDWTRQLEASERNLGRKLSNCSSSKSDLYQIFGLFFVFQGVIVTAVAQASKLTCPNWGLIFSLSLIVSLATIGACVQKLTELAEFKEQHLLERSLYLALYKSIENLKEQGPDFDLVNDQPELRGGYTRDEITGRGSLASGYSSLERFFSVWVFSYAGGVLFLLCAFSVITLVSVPKILC